MNREPLGHLRLQLPTLHFFLLFIYIYTHTYTHTHKGHLKNKVNFAPGVGFGKHFYSFTFFKEINSSGSFLISEDCQNDLLYWLLHLELFLYWRVSMFPLHRLFLTQASGGKLIFNPLIRKFLTKTCFFIHISYSSVNFTWVALLNHQKFPDRPLFKPGTLWFVDILNSFKINILWDSNNLCNKLNNAVYFYGKEFWHILL